MNFDGRMGDGSCACRFSSLRRLIYWAAVLGLALIFSIPAAAQRLTGTLRGQVFDPTGATVPNAQVTATNQETGVSVRITATSTGTYSFPSLIPGLYRVGVEAKGFKNFLATDITVIANQDNVADTHLDLGVVTEVVEVTAGGQFSLVTKTGTNNWHGSGEWYNQNRSYNSLDNLTKNAIDVQHTLPGQPAFDNNRFGGTMGGPIVKNKLFIFGAYEYTYLHGQGSATAFTGPTAGGLATLQANAADSAVTALLMNFPVASANDAGTVTIHPGLTGPALAVPIGNITIFSPNFQREHDAQVNTDYTMGRHQFGARFLINQETFILPTNSTQAQFNQAEPIHNRKIVLNDVWTINSHFVNDLRLQYSFFSLSTLNPCTTCPTDITIGDSLGGETHRPWHYMFPKQITYQILSIVSWTQGTHS